MKNSLLCFITDSKDFDYIDKKTQELVAIERKYGISTTATYTALYTENGLTATDTDEIEYLLQANNLYCLVFALEESQAEMARKFSLYFIDKGYLVFF